MAADDAVPIEYEVRRILKNGPGWQSCFMLEPMQDQKTHKLAGFIVKLRGEADVAVPQFLASFDDLRKTPTDEEIALFTPQVGDLFYGLLF